MSQKAYFLVPSIDYAPDELIKPGQIISSLKAPYIAIGSPIEPPRLYSSYQENWEDERRRSISGSIGIWAQFLATILGISGDIVGNIERQDSTTWRFKRLDTYFIVPDQAYIEASMVVPEVKKFFEENPKKSAYMITGVKVAREAELIRSRRRLLGADGRVGIDTTAVGAPVSGGPKASIQTERGEGQSFTGSSDFVFAYRLIKIYKHSKTGALTSKEKVKGALYGHNSSTSSQQNTPKKDASEADMAEMMVQEFEIEGFDKEDIGLVSTPLGFGKASVRDEGGDIEACEVMWLRKDNE
ncbi:hypothetical protein EG329_000044 [Mollisiaceae sp. DMI_Dod_QoI]|nr:hypothetical protein EG329_000044 [Helotiales sp. DMI_Dod_QoI]